MNWDLIWTVFQKDWKELLKSKQAVLPMILVPLIFCVVLPAVVLLGGSGNVNGSEELLNALPSGLLPQGLDASQQVAYVVLVFLFAPFFLLIPAMVASVTAANSFAGEKERKTIEGLLYTPITDQELVLSKILVSLVPSVLVTWICFVVYTIILNTLGAELFRNAFFPNLEWILTVVLLAPAVSFIALSIIIWVSQRASTVWEAQQTSMIVILPIMGLVVSQATGIMFLSVSIIGLVAVVLFLIDAVAYWWIIKNFDRQRIVAKMI